MSDINDFLYKKAQAHLVESAKVKRLVAGLAADSHMTEPAIVISADLTRRPPADYISSIVEVARLIAGAFKSGGKLLLCGNGGSAADCQHMASEFVGKLRKTDEVRHALPAIALTTDSSFLTAFANDEGFQDVFARQIEALGKPGDILMAISTSGTSPNIIRAVEAARVARIRTIGLTAKGRRLAEITDIAVAVPSANVQHIQEAHLAIEHIICDLVEEILFSESRGAGLGAEPETSEPI